MTKPAKRKKREPSLDKGLLNGLIAHFRTNRRGLINLIVGIDKVLETRDAAALYRMDEWYSRRGLATQWLGW